MNIKEKKELKSNFTIVFVTGVVTVFLANLVGFLIPLFTTYETYAEYKIYTTYINFSGLFHFGMINGVYLKYGDKEYDKLPKEKFKTIVRLLGIIQFFVVLVLGILMFLTDSKNYSYFFVIINIPFININCFFSLVNQFTKRFKIDSAVQIFQSGLWVIFVGVIYSGVLQNAKEMLIGVTVINLLVMLSNIIINREIVFGKKEPYNEVICDIRDFIDKGKSVMLSELIALILINVDLIFVQNLFDIYEFAIYGFAVAIINAAYALINYVNGICYPYLVRAKEISKVGKGLFEIILDVGIILMASYFIVEKIVLVIFSKYSDSIQIIKLLYITILLRLLIMGYYNNICKVENKLFFNVNIVILIISIVLNVVAYTYSHSLVGICVASVISAVIWVIVLEMLIPGGISRLKVWLKIIISAFSLYMLEMDNAIVCIIVYMLINLAAKCIFDQIGIRKWLDKGKREER